MSFREPMAHVRYGKNTELAGATPGVVRPMSTREADRAYPVSYTHLCLSSCSDSARRILAYSSSCTAVSASELR